MNIFIDNRSGTPIYDQIYSQIKAMITKGELHENDPLPSIRNLAKELRISVITTKRAYDELLRDGLVYTLAGKGCFVSGSNISAVIEEDKKQIDAYLRKAVDLSIACKITKDELKNKIDAIYKEGQQ